MPSQPLDHGWNFSPVFDLIGSDPRDIGSPTLRPEIRSPTLPEGGVGLGNFCKLYESLGLSANGPVPPLPPLDESDSSNSEDAAPKAQKEADDRSTQSSNAAVLLATNDKLPAFPTFEDIQAPRTENTDRPEQRHSTVTAPIIEAIQAPPTEVPGTTKKQRRKARRQAEQALQEQAGQEEAVDAGGESRIEIVPETPAKPSRAQSNVGAKIRASPAPVVAQVAVPKTPSPPPRPILVAPATSQPQHHLQSSLQPMPWSHGPTSQHMTGQAPASFQYSLAPQYLSQSQSPQLPHSPAGLVPRTVRPVTLPRQPSQAPPMPVTPSPAPFSSAHQPACPPVRQPTITIRQRVDRHFHFLELLLTRFPAERKYLLSPRLLVNENTRTEGIHVFVDASNIMIGFKDILRNNGVQPYDMSFDSLALLMERRRPTAKRALVGSHRVAHPLPATQRLIGLAKDVGYQCDVQEQVFIVREDSKKKKFFNDVSRIGWQKAIQKRYGSGSDSETGAAAVSKMPSAPKWVEQGVDELLHLKMCQSILDTDVPSTMVLATGDGAEAEMSDGFLAHVERALRRGWKVELITWKQQTNGGYKRRSFRQKWGEQFTIIELDEYLEDLIDTP